MTIIGIRADRALRGRASRLLALATSLAAAPAWADYKLNMPEGVTTTSHEIYDLHMLVFWVCTLIAIGVYGAMVYAIVKFRKSAGAKPAKFSHNTTIEVVWTVIPAAILVALAIPAAETLIRMNDTRNAQLTIKVTGYQWRWQYDYLDDGVKFFSVLDRKSNAARQMNSGIDPRTVENYLLEVDKPMVVPVNTKVRLLVTAADVIHSWWVPDVRREAGRDSGLHQRSLVYRARGRHVSRPVRRALRHGPRLHADRRAGAEPHRVRHVARLAEGGGADLAEHRAMSGQVDGATERARKHREQP